MNARSALYIGSVMHRRFRPRVHRFRYKAFWLLMDLDELDVHAKRLWSFSHNRFNLLSLHDTDHGDGSATPLRDQVLQHLNKLGIDLSGGSIRLLCMPRILGYSFNPISIYFCQRSDGLLAAMLYEVHNTFAERHSYLVPVDTQARTIHQRCDKAFYVSPFLEMAMRYEFSVRAPGEQIAIAIRASQSDRPVLTACLSGTRRPLMDSSLLRAFLTIPALTLKVTGAIHWEALRLWLKGLRLHNHPLPPKNLVTAVSAISKRTDYNQMSYESIEARDAPFLGTLAHKLLQRATRGIEYGQLIVKMPAGRTQVLGRLGFGPNAILHIHDWKFVWRLLTSWDVGFAESYMAGEWSSPDLPALLNLLCRNARMGASSRTMGLMRSLHRLGHVLNRNTRRGSRRNIAAHYDLGNAFYAQWLDRSLSYSSALYRHGGQQLEEAQQGKLDRILELLDLSGRERVLEIGCGWGGLAEQILDRYNCSLTALTLSSEQRDHTQARLRRHIEQKNCDLCLQDYRDTDGTYDRVVSIEMLEAVGEAYWPVYFEKLRERLTPEGIAVLQVITIGEEHFETYRKYPDFIQKYIFPGGMLPTVEIVKQQIERSGMKLVSSELFGSSYARTLIEWRDRFHNAWPNIEPLGFDIRFKRMWEYYLTYCQAGFETGVLNVGLYKIARAS